MAKAAVVQVEITGQDGAALKRFYASLFGWQMHATTTSDFHVVGANGNGTAGGIGTSRDGGPGQVTVYVEVDDVLEHLSYAEELGGRIIHLPQEVRSPAGVFTYGLLADPAGNVIGVSNGLERAAAHAGQTAALLPDGDGLAPVAAEMLARGDKEGHSGQAEDEADSDHNRIQRSGVDEVKDG